MPKIDLFYYGDVTPGQDPHELYRNVEEQIILGDKLGYNGVWVTEHHFDQRGDVPDPLLFLARITGLTQNIRVGTSVVTAALYHPIRLAESAALLDATSGGRLNLGVGTGLAFDPEFAKIWGFKLEDAHLRAREVFEILRQAFDDGVVNFTGEFYEFNNVTISPRPVQSARDLIWAAAGRNSTELSRQHGYRLMIPRPLPLEERLRFNREHREATEGQSEVIHLRSGLVAKTTEEARSRAVEFLREYAKIYLKLEWTGGPDSADFDEIAERLSFAIGTPEQVADKVWQWTEQFGGTEETAIQFQGPYVPQEHVLESIELFATQLPALQGAPAKEALS